MSFQSTVIIVAGLILVVLLIFIGIGMSKQNGSTWPPIVGDCPDYWVDLSGNGARCVNVKNLGTCNASVPEGSHLTMNFSGSPYTGSQGTCSKFNWATGCGITWDGITDGIANPCTTST